MGEKGIKLSCGQRQRIGIARAVYQKPQILILDEATASLDEKTEAKVYNNLFLKKNLTLIIVTHKIKNIRPNDNIIFLEKGFVKFKGKYQNYLSNLNKNFN